MCDAGVHQQYRQSCLTLLLYYWCLTADTSSWPEHIEISLCQHINPLQSKHISHRFSVWNFKPLLFLKNKTFLRCSKRTGNLHKSQYKYKPICIMTMYMLQLTWTIRHREKWREIRVANNSHMWHVIRPVLNRLTQSVPCHRCYVV